MQTFCPRRWCVLGAGLWFAAVAVLAAAGLPSIFRIGYRSASLPVVSSDADPSGFGGSAARGSRQVVGLTMALVERPGIAAPFVQRFGSLPPPLGEAPLASSSTPLPMGEPGAGASGSGGEAQASAGVIREAGEISPRSRVFVHYSTTAADGAADARRVSDYLRTRGFDVVDIRAVSYPIAVPRVRFFFAADATAARRLTGALAEYRLGLPHGQSAVRLQDYAHYRPLPQPGNVEIWLPSGRGRETL